MRHLLLIILMSVAIAAGAQVCIVQGTVISGDLQPVTGANILVKKDTLLIRSGITDEQGKFIIEELDAGNYSFVIEDIGHEIFIQSVVVSGDTTLPLITLKGRQSALEEVTIKAQKPFIEAKADKIVVNVENSILSAGSSVMEVLQRSPGVNVDNNDNIALKGKQGAIIWIDGRPVPMTGTDLAAVLRAMPSSSIEKIELISNPGAKFDAVGGAGIINIKTKKDQRLGLNGSANISYGQGKYPKYGAGININYRNKKVNLYAGYNYAYRYWFNHLMLNRKFLDTVERGKQLFRYDQDNFALFNFRNHIGNLGVDYSIGSATTIGVALSSSTNNFDPRADNASKALDENDNILYRFNTAGRHQNAYYNYAVNAGIRHTFDSTGRMLSADIDYAAFGNNSKQNFVTTYTRPEGGTFLPDYFLKSNLDGLTRIRSLKVDYIHPLPAGFRIESGIKASLATANNKPVFYEKTNDDYVLDTKRSNHFIYNEQINAAYLNAAGDIKKWSLQLGLRLENTNASWEQRTTAQEYDTAYVQLFPSVAAQYHLSAKHDIGLTLSRRIERPNYQQLNPFKYFIDKTTYREGDPYLKPASFYSAELSHIFNQRFITTFTFGINKGVITEVIQPSDHEDSVTVQTNKNLKQMTFVGLSGAYPFQITRWWNNVTNLNIYYALYEGNLANTVLKNGKPTFDINTTNSFMLPGDFSAEVSFFYQARQLYGFMDVQPLWMLNLGVQKHIWEKRATIKLNIQDLFFTGYPRATSDYTGYSEDFVAERETRVVNIAFTYRFGKNTIAPVRKRSSGAEDEIRRAAGNNS